MRMSEQFIATCAVITRGSVGRRARRSRGVAADASIRWRLVLPAPTRRIPERAEERVRSRKRCDCHRVCTTSCRGAHRRCCSWRPVKCPTRGKDECRSCAEWLSRPGTRCCRRRFRGWFLGSCAASFAALATSSRRNGVRQESEDLCGVPKPRGYSGGETLFGRWEAERYRNEFRGSRRVWRAQKKRRSKSGREHASWSDTTMLQALQEIETGCTSIRIV